jgi:hypothetical protein
LDHWRSRLSLSGRKENQVRHGDDHCDDHYRQRVLDDAFAGFLFGVAHGNATSEEVEGSRRRVVNRPEFAGDRLV